MNWPYWIHENLSLYGSWIFHEFFKENIFPLFLGQFMNFSSNELFKNFFQQNSFVSFALHIFNKNSSWTLVHEKCLISSCLSIREKIMNCSSPYYELSNVMNCPWNKGKLHVLSLKKYEQFMNSFLTTLQGLSHLQSRGY